MRFVANFHFDEKEIQFVRQMFPLADEKFFDWLRHIDCRNVKVYACDEGTVVFPNLPLMRIEGLVLLAALFDFCHRAVVAVTVV